MKGRHPVTYGEGDITWPPRYFRYRSSPLQNDQIGQSLGKKAYRLAFLRLLSPWRIETCRLMNSWNEKGYLRSDKSPDFVVSAHIQIYLCNDLRYTSSRA